MQRTVCALAAGVGLGLAVGCASSSHLPAATAGSDTGESACRSWFDRLDTAISAAGVRDGQSTRVAGYPYLRVERFYLGVRPATDDASAYAAWVEQLGALDRDARVHEISNLPEPALAHLGLDSPVAIRERARDCRTRLIQRELDTVAQRERLARSVRVPDSYDIFKRLVGLYPAAAIPFAAGVDALHARRRGTFSIPLEDLPVSGSLVRFVPPGSGRLSTREVADLLARARDNPLRLPVPLPGERERLFATFAPVFEVDTVDDTDRIGTALLHRDDPGRWVDVSRPAVYRKLSYTTFEGRNLLQLNYVVWFPARRKRGALDLLGGHLDGLTLRVTLDEDGRPLMHDSMHNCGCYHLFAPSDRLRPRGSTRGFEEARLVLGPIPSGPARLVARIASGTHYLQRIYRATLDSGARTIFRQAYRWREYRDLRSLARPDGARASWFAEDGLVPGTERAERWLFWPMGIASPGAMRQWGHHAIAFIGRRHFDDSDLIERYFERNY